MLWVSMLMRIIKILFHFYLFQYDTGPEIVVVKFENCILKMPTLDLGFQSIRESIDVIVYTQTIQLQPGSVYRPDVFRHSDRPIIHSQPLYSLMFLNTSCVYLLRNYLSVFQKRFIVQSVLSMYELGFRKISQWNNGFH